MARSWMLFATTSRTKQAIKNWQAEQISEKIFIDLKSKRTFSGMSSLIILSAGNPKALIVMTQKLFRILSSLLTKLTSHTR